MNRANEGPAGAGTSTSALAFGGNKPPPSSGITETWNGTNWTETGDLNTARRSLAGAGTQTTALAFGGQSPVTAATEEWNDGPQVRTIDTD